MITLRSYQEQLITDIRAALLQGHTRIVSQSPTGSGKTVIFTFIIKNSSEKGNCCLIVSDRIELLEQTGGTFEKIGLQYHNLIAGAKAVPSSKVTIAMIETLKRRLKKRLDFQMWVKSLNLVICDEIHKNVFNDLFPYLSPGCIVLGFTATPIRFNNMPELGDFFTSLVNGPGIGNLIEDGWLSKPKYFGVPVDLAGVHIKAGEFDEIDLQNIYTSSEVFAGLRENLQKHAAGKKTIIFCPTIQTSKNVADELGCLHVDGEMSPVERDRVLTAFETDPHGIISNVGILTTGYDHPATECIVLYRATKSLPLYLQCCGRGSRIAPGKNEFTILDFGNNILRHNFWHVDREWKLENDRKRKVRADREDVYPIKDCPDCGAMVPINTKTCPYCGHEWTKSEQEQRFAELQEMEYGHILRKISNGMSVEEIEQIRIARDYKTGWVCHQFKERQQFYDYEKLRGFKHGWGRINSEKYLEN